MNSVIFGLIYLAIGVALLAWGAKLAQIVIALWGLGVGLWIGESIVSHQTLPQLWGLIIIWGIGVIAMILAYAFYQIGLAIIVAFAAFWIAAAGLSFLSLNATLILIIAAAVGLLAGAFAVRSELPYVLLIIVTAIMGAAYTVCGILILVNGGNLPLIGFGPLGFVLHQSTIWIISFVGLAIIGFVIQDRPSTTQITSNTN